MRWKPIAHQAREAVTPTILGNVKSAAMESQMRRVCELLSIPVICLFALLSASPMAKAAAMQSVLGPAKAAGGDTIATRVHGYHCRKRFGWMEHRHGRRGWHEHRRWHRHPDVCEEIYYRQSAPPPYVYIPGPSYYSPPPRYYYKKRRRHIKRRFRNRRNAVPHVRRQRRKRAYRSNPFPAKGRVRTQRERRGDRPDP